MVRSLARRLSLALLVRGFSSPSVVSRVSFERDDMRHVSVVVTKESKRHNTIPSFFVSFFFFFLSFFFLSSLSPTSQYACTCVPLASHNENHTLSSQSVSLICSTFVCLSVCVRVSVCLPVFVCLSVCMCVCQVPLCTSPLCSSTCPLRFWSLPATPLVTTNEHESFPGTFNSRSETTRSSTR